MEEGKKRANSVVTVRQIDGKLEFTVLGAGVLVFDPDKASAENRARAMMHGWKQRISDGAALSRDTDDGSPATPEAKLERMRRIAEHYESGTTEWAMRAAAAPGESAGLIIQAMMRGLGVTLERVEAILAATQTKDNIERTAALKKWAGTKQVAQAILDIKAEKASGGGDAEAMLAELGL